MAARSPAQHRQRPSVDRSCSVRATAAGRWRGGSGEDFPEPNPEHALRVRDGRRNPLTLARTVSFGRKPKGPAKPSACRWYAPVLPVQLHHPDALRASMRDMLLAVLERGRLLRAGTEMTLTGDERSFDPSSVARRSARRRGGIPQAGGAARAMAAEGG